MSDTSGMLPNWLSEAVGDSHDPKEIAQAVFRSREWVEVIAEGVREGEQAMQGKQAGVGPAGGYPSYNQEVARAIVIRLATLYPDVSLPPAGKVTPHESR
ncbi:MAG TPA: hypothetical protein VKA46_04305 [Gemmataceae bacterium]|nr:hypothetical protein [Gemmataceae bacterium]